MENIDPKISLNNTGEIYLCEQCGRCSSACPITGIDDFNIRRFIRSVETSKDELFNNSIPWLCLTCGRCEEACPNGISILKLVRLARKILPKNRIPLVACVEACPIRIDIPGFVRMIAEKEEIRALELIMQKTPIPGILGRVCNRPCESKCKRGRIDKPVSICNLKRYLSDFAGKFLDNMYKPICKTTKKKVLIIGSGPSGLTAAYYLVRKGHSITILEKQNKAGGMLRYGIPAYRLPRSILNYEIDKIINMGVDLKTNIDFDNILDKKIVKNQFDAIFIATGLQSSRNIFLNKHEINGMIFGLDFLKNINSQIPQKVGNNVLVIGGGNVAIDVAMSVRRLGANSVTLACLEKDIKDMPADISEIKIATDEGIKFMNSWGLNKIKGDTSVSGAELINCLSVFDKYNNFKPIFGSRKIVLDVDQIIIAIGQTCDKNSLRKLSSFLGSDLKIANDLIQVTSENRIAKNIFAGGDAVYGPKSVVNAVESGRNVASSIDKFLGGDGILWLNLESNINLDEYKKFHVSSSYIKRQITKKLLNKKRISSFSEISLGLDQEQVNLETSRCLKCDMEYTLACF